MNQALSRDDAWIGTARCPSCNECQLINDRMFDCDERKQAFILDQRLRRTTPRNCGTRRSPR